MNNLSSPAPPTAAAAGGGISGIIPLPAVTYAVLFILFLIGPSFSIFTLILLHNPISLVIVLCVSALIATFLICNSPAPPEGALLYYLQSSPDSDLRYAAHGQLIKVTGVVSRGDASLESSYEKVNGCIYTSTMLYEYQDVFNWRMAYSERFSIDFYIIDRMSGVRILVKAGAGCKLIPLIIESRLVQTTTKCSVLSSTLRKWLRERNLSTEPRQLCLKKGYIRDGSTLSVIGMVQKHNDGVIMIVQPQEIVSSGCMWRKLMLPVDYDGLLIGNPQD